MAYNEVSEGMASPNTGGSSDGSSTKVSVGSSRLDYESPFIDMTSTYLPKTIKGIFKFVAAYVFGDGLVSQCITKMSEYPITKLIYNEDRKSAVENDNTIKYWKSVLEGRLKILHQMKKTGMDRYAYGNSITSINYPFKRMFDCKQCKNTFAADAIKYKYKSYKFYAKCPKCKHDGEVKARDLATQELAKLSIVHWDVFNIDIKYNNITDEHFYFYKIPETLAKSIKEGDLDIVGSTRLEVIEAVKRDKPIKLMSDNVYHMKRSGPQYIHPAERGWGIPLIMPIMKDIFHIKVLKKGNEMIAFEHIVPLRFLFPQGTGDISPHAVMNLSTWKSKIEEELGKWKKDPNRITVLPVPMGIQNMGGDAKMLMVTPEIKATEDAIITGTGMIPEIIRGGASWSGSNVSLRVVENTFLNHREESHGFLDFIVSGISKYFKINKINIKMSDFKMADDLQKKKMVVDASMPPNGESLISKSTVIKELGFDPEEEYQNKMDEIHKIVKFKVDVAKGEAEAQGEGSIINAMYSADAEIENGKRRETASRKAFEESNVAKDKESQDRAEAVDEEVVRLEDLSNIKPGTITIPNLILLLTRRFSDLSKTNMDEFKMRLLAMKNSMPALHSEVYNNLKELNIIEADLTPDLEATQKYTPGQIPEYTQGNVTTAEPPSISESNSPVSTINKASAGVAASPLPEARPPKSTNSSI